MKNPNIPALPDWARVIVDYAARNAQEEAERLTMLRMIAREGDFLLSRDCTWAHMTASSMIVSPDRRRTLMAFHRIYNSWAWTGGHNDGDGDFEAVALREAREETGIDGLRRLGGGIASLEILPVWAHEKRGAQMGSHLHLNVSFLFEADDTLPLRVKRDENSAVGWIDVCSVGRMVTEPQMIPIYRKLLDRANDC